MMVQRRLWPWIQTILGVLLVLAGIVVGAVPAAAQNAVGASTPGMINTVGSPTDIGAGQRLGKSVPQPQIVVATGVAAEAEGSGAANSYIDLTRGSSVRNIGTNATHTEFADTLTNSGWTSRLSKDGSVQIFEKDGAKYILRSKNSSGYPGWTADFTPAGSTSHTLELRLGYTP